jgi:hypothetical protein
MLYLTETMMFLRDIACYFANSRSQQNCKKISVGSPNALYRAKLHGIVIVTNICSWRQIVQMEVVDMVHAFTSLTICEL